MDPVKFIEGLTLVGDYSHTPLTLSDWEKEPIIKLCSGQYSDCLWGLPRSSGKTTIGAALMIYWLLGQGRYGQELYSVAASEKQAAILFRYASQMLRSDPALMDAGQVMIHDHDRKIISEKFDSLFEVLCSNENVVYGKKPSLILADECHSWRTRAVLDSLTTGSGARRNPLTIMMSTAGNDRFHWFYHEWETACKIRDGAIINNSYLPVIHAASDDDDPFDEATWYKANPALGSHISIEFMRKEIAKVRDIPSKLNAFKRFYLNIWVDSALDTPWIDAPAWVKCHDDYTEHDLVGASCTAALDLSSVKDLTALTLFFPDSGRTLSWGWLPGDGLAAREDRDLAPYTLWLRQGWLLTTTGSRIVHKEVAEKINDVLQKYNVTRFVADPYAIGLIEPYLTQTPDIYKQSAAWMSTPAKWFETAVHEKRVHWNSPLLSWTTLNTVITTDKYEMISLAKDMSRKRIDNTVALVMAIGAWLGGDHEEDDDINAFYSNKANYIFDLKAKPA